MSKRQTANRSMAEMPQLQGFGHVAPFEEAQAKELIDKQFIEMTGRPFEYKVCGYFIALKIYVRPEELKEIRRDDGSVVKLYIPQRAQQNDKYQSCAALVVGVGPQAYKGKNPDGSDKFPEGPWCRVGDWVCIPRYEAHLFYYRKVALGLLPDDRIMGIINDPTDVEAIHLSDEY